MRKQPIRRSPNGIRTAQVLRMLRARPRAKITAADVAGFAAVSAFWLFAFACIAAGVR